jgi:hypothetical protein
MGSGIEKNIFDDFVRRQQESAAEAENIDWNKEKEEWLAHLDALYKKIEALLSEYVSSGRIRREYKSVRLNEQHIGPYIAKKMLLTIGAQQVELLPIGTLFIGAKGRVDVVGPAGKAELLLVDKKRDSWPPRVLVTVRSGGKSQSVPSKPPQKVEWEWRIVTRPPERRLTEITQDNFFQLIMEVANA